MLSDRDALERRARGALLKPTHGKTLGDFAAQLAVYDIELYLSILGEKVTEDEYLALVRRIVRETFGSGGVFENMSIAEDLTQMSDIQKQFDDTFAKYQKEAGEIRSYQINGVLPPEMRNATLDYDLFFKCTPRFVQTELKKLRQNGPTQEFELDPLFAQAAKGQTNPVAAGASQTYQIGDKVAGRHPLGLRVWSGRIVGIANGTYTVRVDYASNPARHAGEMTFLDHEIQPHQGTSILEGIDGLKSLLGK